MKRIVPNSRFTQLYNFTYLLVITFCCSLLVVFAHVSRVNLLELQNRDATYAAGTHYFVDCNNGDDSANGVSEITAWRTLSRANTATLTSGDALLFKKGCTWNGTLNAFWNGSPTGRIVITSYGSGDLPVIKNSVNGKEDIKITGSYITVDGIHASADAPAREVECQNNPKGYIVGFSFTGGAHDSTVSNSIGSNLYAGVSINSGSHYNKVLQNSFENNTMMSNLDRANPDNDSGAFGVLLMGDDNEVAYNQISGSDACSYDYVRDGSAVEIYNGSRNSIHHNKAINSNDFTELGKDSAHSSTDNVYAYNTFVSSNTQSAFLVTRGFGNFGPVLRTVAYNNSIYLTGSSSQGVVCSSCGTNILTLRNNILWANWKSIYTSAPFNESNNIYWKTGGSPLLQLQGGATLSSTSKVADPLYLSPLTRDLHVSQNSPAVNAGSSESVTKGFTTDADGHTVPANGAVDIGAYELNSSSVSPTPTASPIAGASVTLVGAGDAGRCDRIEDNQTAKIVSDIIASKPAGSVRAYYGGDVYEDGNPYEMSNCYGGTEFGLPPWGSFKNLTWPIIGDHELHSTKGTSATAGYAYYDYWGYPPSGPHPDGLGERYKSWYSKDFGAWHIIFLNINNNQCQLVACGVGSEQYNWFKAELEQNSSGPNKPLMVIMHHTYWTVGSNAGRTLYRPLLDLMYTHKVEVLLQHDSHTFQAFNPMRPDSTLDAQNGIRAFIVGFGGAPFTNASIGMSTDRIAHTNFTNYGVIEFTLNPSNYSWKIHTVGNKDTWSGSSAVHNRTVGSPEPTVPTTPSPSPVAVCESNFFSFVAPPGYSFSKGCLRVGTTIYSDDTRFSYFLLPPPLASLPYIKTGNIKEKDDTSFSLPLTVTRASNIYVFYRKIPGQVAPAWLASRYTRITPEGYDNLQQFVLRKNDLGLIGVYDIYKRNSPLPAGATETLGTASDSRVNAYSMYVTAVQPL